MYLQGIENISAWLSVTGSKDLNTLMLNSVTYVSPKETFI